MSAPSHPSRRRRSPAAWVAAVLLLAAVTLVGGAPAGAAPGDASAVGVAADLGVTVLGVDVDINGSLGAVNAPPSDSASLVGASATLSSVPASAAFRAAAIETTATSDAGVGSSASAQVEEAELDIPLLTTALGDSLFASTTVIRAEADCPVGGPPTASVSDTIALVVDGTVVVVDADGAATVTLTDTGGLAAGTVTLQLNTTSETSDSAAATAVDLSFDVELLDGTITVAGDLTIAQASCESFPVAPAPTTASITPDEGPTTGGTPVTITGADFVPGETSVDIGGNVVPEGEVAVAGDGMSLDFTTPAHDAGPVDVTVTTPGGTSSPPLTFTYIPAPTTASITPDEGPTSGGTGVTITGADFVPGATSVTIGGNVVPEGEVAVAGDGMSLDFTTPAHAVGAVDVTVTTPGGTSSPPLAFTYIEDPPPPTVPTATDIDPDQGPTTGGTTVVITGTGFVDGATTVTVDGTTIPAEDVTVGPDGTTLSFDTLPHAVGAVDVTVTTDGGTTSPPLTFTYVVPPDQQPPTASETDPAQGPTTGGNPVGITGSGFVPGATTVTIGGVEIPATEVMVSMDGTRLAFVAPPHAAGEAAITVTTPLGSVEAPPYTYVADASGGPNGAGANGNGALPASSTGSTGTGSTGSGTTGGSGDGSGGTGGSLARTGTDVSGLVLMGLMALLGGTVLLAGRRRLGAHRDVVGR